MRDFGCKAVLYASHRYGPSGGDLLGAVHRTPRGLESDRRCKFRLAVEISDSAEGRGHGPPYPAAASRRARCDEGTGGSRHLFEQEGAFMHRVFPRARSARASALLVVSTVLAAVTSLGGATPSSALPAPASISSKSFGTVGLNVQPGPGHNCLPVSGQASTPVGVDLYTLTNRHGMSVSLTNYGGIIQAINVPGRDSRTASVLPGLGSVAGYTSHP